MTIEKQKRELIHGGVIGGKWIHLGNDSSTLLYQQNTERVQTNIKRNKQLSIFRYPQIIFEYLNLINGHLFEDANVIWEGGGKVGLQLLVRSSLKVVKITFKRKLSL